MMSRRINNNPCNICIVNPMCKEPCCDFYTYLINHFKKYRKVTPLTQTVLRVIADEILRGEAYLTYDKHGWDLIKFKSM